VQARRRSLSLGGSAAFELAARARRAALVAVSPYLAEERCADETPLPLSARLRCDVPAAVSDAKPAPRVSRGACSRCSLSLGRRRSTRPCCARAPCCAGLGLPTPYQRALRRREASPSARNRRTTCQLRPPASSQRGVSRSEGAPALTVSWEKRGSTRACFERAPCRDGCRRLTPRRSAPHRREDSLLRCNTVVRRASCGLQLQARTTCVAQHKRVGARCLWEEAQHSSLLSVRVVPRWLWSVLTLPKDAATARLSSPSAHGRGATYQLQPPASCQRRVARATLARRHSLCLGRRRSTRPWCARAVLRWN
jgi:hypothetical protein